MGTVKEVTHHSGMSYVIRVDGWDVQVERNVCAPKHRAVHKHSTSCKVQLSDGLTDREASNDS